MFFFFSKCIELSIMVRRSTTHGTMVSTEIKARVFELWLDPTFELTGLQRFQQRLRESGINLRIPDIW